MNRRVWVTNFAAGTIYVYDDQANFLFQIGDESVRRSAQPGFFEKPQAVAFGNGFAYVTDVGNQYPGDSPVVKILDASTGPQVGTIPGTVAASSWTKPQGTSSSRSSATRSPCSRRWEERR